MDYTRACAHNIFKQVSSGYAIKWRLKYGQKKQERESCRSGTAQTATESKEDEEETEKERCTSRKTQKRQEIASLYSSDETFCVLNLQQRKILENYKISRAYFDLVIELGMGKSSKKKPITKKERAERRKKRKEKRSKK